MSKSHLINANIHRVKEGARVLEDIARFILRDEKLFAKTRDIRHALLSSAPTYNVQTDIGGTRFSENNVRTNLLSVVQANAMRMQEALRVLEEMADHLHSKQLMKKLRYQAYDVYVHVYQSVKKYLKQPFLQGLYLIVDTDVINQPIEYLIDIINQSPVNIVQYRNKSATKKNFYQVAEKIKQRLSPDKLFIINDHIDIALDLADGVHIGQDDYPLDKIRNIVPSDFIVGISCHNLLEAKFAATYDVSYIAVGCLFETKSKNDTIPVTITELQQICHEIQVPVCAIGGINDININQVLTAKVNMVAIISYVWKTKDPLQIIIHIHEKIINPAGIQNT